MKAWLKLKFFILVIWFIQVFCLFCFLLSSTTTKKRALTVWVYSALQLWKRVMRVTEDFRLHKLCRLFSFTTVVRTSWWKLGRARPHTKLLVSIPSWVPLHCVVVRNYKVMLVFFAHLFAFLSNYTLPRHEQTTHWQWALCDRRRSNVFAHFARWKRQFGTWRPRSTSFVRFDAGRWMFITRISHSMMSSNYNTTKKRCTYLIVWRWSWSFGCWVCKIK